MVREKYCVPRGVKHILSDVKKVNVDDNGVSELILDDGTVITSDLYIDCTGWKSLLLGQALKEPFESYNDIIPNNRAWAVQIPYVDREKELEPYTNCTAINNGWVWNIPLWTRIGTGYVYSDKFISKEDALEEFKNYLKSDKMTVPNKERITDDLKFKDIEMRIGIHERTWVKNVVAIGLSAGFIEPLESNGLFTVHEFLLKLVNSINKEKVNQWEADLYNKATHIMFDGFAKFVSLHYLLSQRDDTEYWREISERSVMQRAMTEPPDTFFLFLHSKYKSLNYQVTGSGIHCIANGLNYPLISEYNVKNDVFYGQNDGHKAIVDKLITVWENNKAYAKKLSEDCPSITDYLQQRFYS